LEFRPISRGPLTKFYSEVFGWKFQEAALSGPEYCLCETGADGPGINSAVMKRRDPRQAWMNYVDVANIEAILQHATNLGAKIALPKTSVPGVGAFAAIVDPEGNTADSGSKSRAD
jgi:predicted enzyme related to lactoylglutathione lyase